MFRAVSKFCREQPVPSVAERNHRAVLVVGWGACQSAREQLSSDTSKCGSNWHLLEWNFLTKSFWLIAAPLSLSLSQNRSVHVAQRLRLFLLLSVLACISYSWLVLIGLMAREQIALSKAVPRTGYQTSWCVCFKYGKLFLHVRGQASNCFYLVTCQIPARRSSRLPP